VVVFLPLQMEHIIKIVDLMIDKTRKNLAERKINIQLTDAARVLLAEEGYDPAYGARPLRRVVQRTVDNQISRGILQGEFRDGDTIVVDADGRKIVTRLYVPSAGEVKPSAS